MPNIALSDAGLRSIEPPAKGTQDYWDTKFKGFGVRVSQGGETAGIEDPKKKNHAMSAVRYGLTMLAGAGTTYDPHKQERERVEVTITRRNQQKNGAR